MGLRINQLTRKWVRSVTINAGGTAQELWKSKVTLTQYLRFSDVIFEGVTGKDYVRNLVVSKISAVLAIIISASFSSLGQNCHFLLEYQSSSQSSFAQQTILPRLDQPSTLNGYRHLHGNRAQELQFVLYFKFETSPFSLFLSASSLLAKSRRSSRLSILRSTRGLKDMIKNYRSRKCTIHPWITTRQVHVRKAPTHWQWTKNVQSEFPISTQVLQISVHHLVHHFPVRYIWEGVSLDILFRHVKKQRR